MAAITLTDYSMLNVLEALADNHIQIKANGTYIDKNGTSHHLEVFDNDYFKRNVLMWYRNWTVTLWDKPETAFPDLFTSWWASRKDLYLKQAYAYTLKYNPIENYASHEVLTNDITEHEYDSSMEHEYDSATDLTHGLKTETTLADADVTTTHPAKKLETTYPARKDETTYPVKDTTTTHPAKKVETTPYDTTETTTPNNATTTHSTKGFNSSAFVEVDKDVQSGSTTKTTTHTGVTKETVDETYTGDDNVNETYTGKETVDTTYTGKETIDETYTGTDKVSTEYKNTQVSENSGKDTTDHSGKDTDTHSGKDTTTRNYTIDKTGNIGVQTSAQMLEMEFNGLKQDLAKRALDEFIERYCFLSYSVS